LTVAPFGARNSTGQESVSRRAVGTGSAFTETKGYSIRYLLLAACCLLIAWSLPLSAADAAPPGLEDVPQVVAEINGTPILRNDLVRELVGSSANDAIDRLVRRALINQAAKATGIGVSEEEIERQFAEDKRDLNAELISMPWENGKEVPVSDIIHTRFRMSIDEYKNLIVRQRLLTKRCMLHDLKLTDQTLLDFFSKHQELFQTPTRYRASHILITPIDLRDFHRGLRFRSPLSQRGQYEVERREHVNRQRDHKVEYKDRLEEGDPRVGEKRRFAEKLLRDIRAGVIEWDQAVQKYSQDPLDRPYVDSETKRQMPPPRRQLNQRWGDVGEFHSGGPLEPAFYEGAKDIKPGEIGGPVQTIYGFHLIKMLEVKVSPPLTFEQCRDKVERLYIEDQIQSRGETWFSQLMEDATMQVAQSLLWPAPPPRGSTLKRPAEADPVVVRLGTHTICRSEVWRELLRGEADEALDRLIHYQVVMTMLKEMGVERMEWESANPLYRQPKAPPAKPVVLDAVKIDMELNDDRLKKDLDAPDMTFAEYIYIRYGQSVEEYKQKIEAGMVMLKAIRQRVKCDEQTLLTEFALAKEQYDEPIWYELSHILIIPSGGMDRADKTAQLGALTIAEQVRSNYLANPTPENWRNLVQMSMDSAANKARDGGLGSCFYDMRNPDFPEGPALYNEVKKQKLERGQVSLPIRTFRGFHIVRVDAVHPAMVADFNRVKGRVERDYLMERAKMQTDIWLRSLTASAKIKRHYGAAPTLAVPLSQDTKLPIPRD
jgi:hypothetical protein